jgi:ArsR family transcriptional regulator
MKEEKKRAKKNEPSLPEEVAEAIDEMGGLSKLDGVIPNVKEIMAEADLHHILSDKTRLTILYSIGCCDMCPCILKEYLKISDSRLSYHLAMLEEHGLVTSYPKKNWRIFRITERGKIALAKGESRQ